MTYMHYSRRVGNSGLTSYQHIVPEPTTQPPSSCRERPRKRRRIGVPAKPRDFRKCCGTIQYIAVMEEYRIANERQRDANETRRE